MMLSIAPHHIDSYILRPRTPAADTNQRWTAEFSENEMEKRLMMIKKLKNREICLRFVGTACYSFSVK
jgi:hypothetical protein